VVVFLPFIEKKQIPIQQIIKFTLVYVYPDSNFMIEVITLICVKNFILRMVAYSCNPSYKGGIGRFAV
jgi:hypothetical protein